MPAPNAAALKTYSGSAHELLNSKLRGKDVWPHVDHPLTDDEELLVRLLDEAIAGSPLPEPVTVYRGFNTDQLHPLNKAFSSVSMHPDEAYEFGRGYGAAVVQFDLPAGFPAAYVDPHSTEVDQGELLLPRGLELEYGKPYKTTVIYQGSFERDLTVIPAKVVSIHESGDPFPLVDPTKLERHEGPLDPSTAKTVLYEDDEGQILTIDASELADRGPIDVPTEEWAKVSDLYAAFLAEASMYDPGAGEGHLTDEGILDITESVAFVANRVSRMDMWQAFNYLGDLSDNVRLREDVEYFVLRHLLRLNTKYGTPGLDYRSSGD